jgi:hypothetical protein
VAGIQGTKRKEYKNRSRSPWRLSGFQGDIPVLKEEV